MTVYVVFRKDYEHRKGELIGMLVERRKDMRGKTPLESGLKWARWGFGHMVKDKKDIFVHPQEMEIGEENRLFSGKGLFTKEEFLEAMKTIGQLEEKNDLMKKG